MKGFENTPARLYHLSHGQREPEVFWSLPSLPGQNVGVERKRQTNRVFSVRLRLAGSPNQRIYKCLRIDCQSTTA
jgi:hypothetical protein